MSDSKQPDPVKQAEPAKPAEPPKQAEPVKPTEPSVIDKLPEKHQDAFEEMKVWVRRELDMVAHGMSRQTREKMNP